MDASIGDLVQISIKQIEVQQMWEQEVPVFFQAIEKLSRKYTPSSEGPGFQYRLNYKTGALETNIPMMRSLYDFSMPPLFAEPDGEKGVSCRLLCNNLAGIMLGKGGSAILRVDLCRGVPKIIPYNVKLHAGAAGQLENRFLTCVDVFAPLPEPEVPAKKSQPPSLPEPEVPAKKGLMRRFYEAVLQNA